MTRTVEPIATGSSGPTQPTAGAWPVPDSHQIDRYADDPTMAALLRIYLPEDLRRHIEPVLAGLGARVGGEIDDLALDADRNPPVLAHRTRDGQDHQRLIRHPAYRRLEEIAFGELGLAAMSHRGGVLGWPQPLPPQVKYAITYLFVQAEFGLCCPVNMTDSLTRTIGRYGDEELLGRYLARLTSTDLDALAQGAMFMTEHAAGSDVGGIETTARPREDGSWALRGDKWFCSNADADLALVLARPEGAEAGTRGIGLFLMPKDLEDGRRNSYRIVRLKDKLGTRSMASGEIVLDDATAYLVGALGEGFKQMTDMINSSRLSNGVRAAGLMRRGFSEARYVSLHRQAFGDRLIELPLQRRQLIKLLVPTEQARAMYMHTAKVFAEADAGDQRAVQLLRILTPLLKFRACRDARKVAGDAMEARGGVGYIEEYSDARVLRDSYLGSIWEGTSNIVALDVVRAAHRAGCLPVLLDYLSELLDDAALPADARARIDAVQTRVAALMDRLADASEQALARQAATALYHLTSAVILAWEGSKLAAAGAGWNRLALAGTVLTHRLGTIDPLEPRHEDPETILALVLDRPVDQAEALACFAPVP